MKRLFLFSLLCIFFSVSAHADYGIVDSLNLAPFVPMVLDTLMSVAMSGYEFFVGNGDGIIYVLVWGFMAVYIAMYLLKMYFPKNWLGFFGMSGGGEMEKGISGIEIGTNLLKPAIRAIIAAAILLPIKPQYITNVIIDPFLQFGSIYTENISRDIFQNVPWGGAPAKQVECPPGLLTKEYMSPESCRFIVQPISDISNVNNQMVKRGLELFTHGISGMMTLFVHNGGQSFMNIISGIILVLTFVSSNFFMALLIIQGIFDFGMALILYPFKVLTFVAGKPSYEKWVDFWPPFEGIIGALKKLVITMIACAFVLAINIAIIRALFNWNQSVFVVAAGGYSHSNVPVSDPIGFGQHSILWLSSLLTLYLMFRIFDMTKKKIQEYSGASDALYKQATGDFNSTREYAKKVGANAKKLWDEKVLGKK